VKIIREHIDFERGIEPKTAMNIGIMNIDWGLDMVWIDELIKDGRTELINYKSALILIIKIKDMPEPFLACSNIKVSNTYYLRSRWSKTREEALLRIKKQIDKHLLKESINFERGLPILIKKWFEKIFPAFMPKYRINENGTITLLEDLEIPDADLNPGFPDYINFKHIEGSIHLDYTGLKYLSGLPKTCIGYFSCEGNNLESLEGAPKVVHGDFFCRDNPGGFTKVDVKKVSKVLGKIYSEDSLKDE